MGPGRSGGVAVFVDEPAEYVNYFDVPLCLGWRPNADVEPLGAAYACMPSTRTPVRRKTILSKSVALAEASGQGRQG